MMFLIWESTDMSTAIWRHGPHFWLTHLDRDVLSATTYVMACRYAKLEFICGNERCFPVLQEDCDCGGEAV